MSEKVEIKFTYKVDVPCFKRTYPGRDPKQVCHEALLAFQKDGTIIPCVEVIGHHRNPRKQSNKPWTVSRGRKKLKALFTTLGGVIGGAVDQAVDGYAGPYSAPVKRAVDRRAAARRGALTRQRERAIFTKQAGRAVRLFRARQYQSKLRELKAEHGYTHKQAQAEYRRLNKAGRKPK